VKDLELEKAVNDSGFPMQLGLKHIVETSGVRWEVALSEHPWRDPASGEDRFLDLALRQGNDQLLVIECKRSRETDWIFIREPTRNPPNNQRREGRAWVTARKQGNVLRLNGWCGGWFEPRSPVAQYCVIRKNNQRTQELLERTAAEVVRATEALAGQNLAIHAPRNIRFSCVYVPVIVSTARLLICDVDPAQFDPAIGEIPGDEFSEVSMVRFSKSFGHPTTYGDATRLEDIAAYSGSSVLVVQAKYSLEFLQQWHVEFDTDTARELWHT
jgi:hypothetical protein